MASLPDLDKLYPMKKERECAPVSRGILLVGVIFMAIMGLVALIAHNHWWF